jgi:hypothetical protein
MMMVWSLAYRFGIQKSLGLFTIAAANIENKNS